ncbi:MAG: hypothetical protein GYA24_20785 [Candidatus Lokiarchaeota archaeon]|nr:hypothetical protein [Candidatus Lokiarchaeota archaeon]
MGYCTMCGRRTLIGVYCENCAKMLESRVKKGLVVTKGAIRSHQDRKQASGPSRPSPPRRTPGNPATAGGNANGTSSGGSSTARSIGGQVSRKGGIAISKDGLPMYCDVCGNLLYRDGTNVACKACGHLQKGSQP